MIWEGGGGGGGSHHSLLTGCDQATLRLQIIHDEDTRLECRNVGS